jgi:hypothetical protein
MDPTSELGPESLFESPFESVIVAEVLAQEEPTSEQHAEINARRAKIENSEMLRHLRSL